MSNKSGNAGLRVMALIEGAKGVLVLGAGLGLLSLVHRNVQLLAEELVRHLHLNPARHFPHIFLHLAANLSDRRLWLLAAAATGYSLMRLIEAYGLWHDWRSIKWFAVVSGGIYIPVEVHAVLHHITWARLTVLGINTLLVAYLVLILAYERRQRTLARGQPLLVGRSGAPPTRDSCHSS